jgi:uncharacterized protein YjbI with pentapeptide repeats
VRQQINKKAIILGLIPKNRQKGNLIMANPEHLAILKQGVVAWNKWRTDQPGIKPDLSGAYMDKFDLAGACLKKAFLGRAKLRGAILSKALLMEARLRETELDGADLSGADLSGADLSGADLRGANLRGADLRGANLCEVNLGEAELNKANLSGAKLKVASLKKVTAKNALFIDASLCEANLKAAILRGTNFKGANFRGSNLNGADLSGAVLTGANLSEASLGGAFLRGVNLRNAELSGANLTMAHMKNACLRGANLSGSILRRTKLNKANLRGANLSGANLWEAFLGKADLNKANLSDAILTGANLSEALLKEANLTGSILLQTTFTGAVLSGCKVYGISAWDVKLKNAMQEGLIISREGQPIITVDNVEVAQLVYMLISHKKIRNVIDTMTGKAVLLLGRFGDGRKAILDAIAIELRKRNMLPIIFDFDPPRDRDVTETVMTLAGLCKYVIADLTQPKSVPHEARTVIPDLAVPFVPLIEGSEDPYSMFPNLHKYPWVLDLVRYENQTQLLAVLESQILQPAEEKYLFWQKKKKELNEAIFKRA